MIMNLALEPKSDDDRRLDAASWVLAAWYAAHPSILRLWAVRDARCMRVVVTLEPSPDSDDLYPVWLANGHDWAHDLQSRLEAPVQLEVQYETSLDELGVGADSVLIAELFWRDSSVPP